MTHTSSCFPGPFLTAETQTSESSSAALRPPRGPLLELAKLKGLGEEGEQPHLGPKTCYCSHLPLRPTRLPVLAPRPSCLFLCQLLFPPLCLRHLLLPVLVLLLTQTGALSPNPVTHGWVYRGTSRVGLTAVPIHSWEAKSKFCLAWLGTPGLRHHLTLPGPTTPSGHG